MVTSSKTCCSTLRAWLQLMRIANLPTAISNVAAGYVATTAIASPVSIRKFAPLVIASCLLYCGGMILNDAFDADEDAVERPGRPIPSDRISRRTAFSVGFGFLLLAMLIPMLRLIDQTQLTTCVGWPGFSKRDIWLLVIIWMIALTILLYNGLLKKTFLAPPLMGTCRTLNILLGAGGGALFASRMNGLEPSLVWFAVSVGVFVMGITLLARSEAKPPLSRFRLVAAALVMLVGLLMIAAVPVISTGSQTALTTSSSLFKTYFLFIAVIAAPIVRRLFFAVRLGTPATVGPAIVTSLTSLIFLDAAYCFLVRPDQPIYAGAVALLIVPVMILRRFSAQT